MIIQENERLNGFLTIGFDDYGLKYHLQKELNILKQSRMISVSRVTNLGLEDWLRDHRVLIILDEQHQLEALANKTSWFGPGNHEVNAH